MSIDIFDQAVPVHVLAPGVTAWNAPEAKMLCGLTPTVRTGEYHFWEFLDARTKVREAVTCAECRTLLPPKDRDTETIEEWLHE